MELLPSTQEAALKSFRWKETTYCRTTSLAVCSFLSLTTSQRLSACIPPVMSNKQTNFIMLHCNSLKDRHLVNTLWYILIHRMSRQGKWGQRLAISLVCQWDFRWPFLGLIVLKVHRRLWRLAQESDRGRTERINSWKLIERLIESFVLETHIVPLSPFPSGH